MKQMAIIKNISFGVRDTDKAMLTFDVRTDESSGALICIKGEDALKLIEKLCGLGVEENGV